MANYLYLSYYLRWRDNGFNPAYCHGMAVQRTNTWIALLNAIAKVHN